MQTSPDSTPDHPLIRTPDQRLRVFVSSTLVELADERVAVRRAIEQLRLAPVMFELGARPHPPRDLYRAYLAQSDIFVGLYWQSYGWVAPEQQISGLEDEYELATGMPRLIYIKKPADRQPRLNDLIDRIRTDDRTSYRYFSTPEELADSVERDLALLLSERFDTSRAAERTVPRPTLDEPAATLPAPLDSLVGREADVAGLTAMLAEPTTRLITIIGPGGIGKTRLAIEVARALSSDFSDCVGFVNLAAVVEPRQVAGAIAQALGVRNSGDEPIERKVSAAIGQRRMLLVLDNFEQVTEAGPELLRLLAASPRLVLVVTSRSPLRVRGEHTFVLGPLALPDSLIDLPGALRSPSVALFVARARAAKPDFELTADNVSAVIRICRSLDGLPLAIELVAARIRLLPPATMIDRLDRHLPVLVDGAIRDLPERQRTLRATIDWSLALIPAEATSVLAQLGTFGASFSLDAAEAVVSPADGVDTLSLLGVLVDSSLVRQEDRGDAARFDILASVREWARERLEKDGALQAALGRHAAFYQRLAERLEIELEGPAQVDAVSQLAEEHENIELAMRLLLDRRDWSGATAFAWQLYIYWWVAGHLGEVRDWMAEVLESSGEPDAPGDSARAVALYFTGAITFWEDPSGGIVPGLETSARLFHDEGEWSGEALARISLALAFLTSPEADPERAEAELENGLALFRTAGDRWGEAFALIALGRVALLQQRLPQALDRFQESLTVARRQRDQLGEAIALHHLGWAHVVMGDVADAEACFRECLALSARLAHVEGVAYGLEGLVAISAVKGAVDEAGTLLGASETLRQQTGTFNVPSFSFHGEMVSAIRAGAEADAFEAAVDVGRSMSWHRAVAYAQESSGPAVSDVR